MATATDTDTLTNETVELLQQLIRNQCVNDGTEESGQEDVSARLLRDELDNIGLDYQLFETAPGRTSLVARYEGTDPSAPAVCLMGHTDVVPVNADGWSQDPFGGELLTAPDGTREVWGRGAVDMLNLTSSMFVAFRDLVRTGTRYPGDIVYFAVADEEAGGGLGAKHLVEHDWDALKCDYVLTEFGGTPSIRDDGTTILLTVGEKGFAGRRIVVHGTPSHGSAPYATDNALVKVAEIVNRIAAHDMAPRIDESFAARLKALGVDPDMQTKLLDPTRIHDALAELPPTLARNLHACTHITMSANVLEAGNKLNTVADRAELQVDIRMLPGDTQVDVDRHLREIIGPDLLASCEISPALPDLPDAAHPSATDNAMWAALTDSIQIAYPDAHVLPSLVTGGTDARFFRQRGVPSYGAGLLSSKISLPEFMSRFHGNDERIDVESLELTTQLWRNVLDRLWR